MSHFTVSFTGHRPKDLFGYRDVAAWSQLRKRIAEYLETLCSLYDHVTVITGGAQGVDQIAFWASVDTRQTRGNLDTIVHVPFAGQESKWLSNGLFSQTEYKQMLDAADKVEILYPTLPSNTRQAVQLLMSRNQSMVNNSDMLIAVTDMDIANPPSHGGTAAAVRYAKSQGKKIAQIRPRA